MKALSRLEKIFFIAGKPADGMNGMAKTRLICFWRSLVFLKSRERAKAAIMAAKSRSTGFVWTRPAPAVAEDAVISLVGEKLPFVSRAA